jgi:hypothetical protein
MLRLLLVLSLATGLSARADAPTPEPAAASGAPSEDARALAASVLVQGGRAFPGGPLAAWVDPGTAVRVKLFGGARVRSVRWLSAVGLGLDFTYSAHGGKPDYAEFKYRRFLWDWFFIPISFNDVVILTPGLGWLLTDVEHPRAGVAQTSIRPAFVLTLGSRFPVAGKLGLRADVRGEHALADRERATGGGELNLTGTFWGAFAGLDLQL